MSGKAAIGWIGLGKLGLPIAARIADAGHAVAGYDIAQERRDAASAKGIAVVTDPGEAAGKQVVFSCLPDDRALRSAALGDRGILKTMSDDAIYVEISTVSPEVSAEVARVAEEAGIAYLRLPISGNASIAHTGNLTCFASGPKAAFEAVRPVLSTFTRAQIYLGEGEEARYAKLAVNLMLAVTAVMMGESLALARKGNIGWQDMLNVLADSAAASPMVKYKVDQLARRDFTSTFSCYQMAKDLDLILGAARSANVPMPVTALARETFAAIIGRGMGEDDFIAPVKHIEWLAGMGEPDRKE
ncbi:MAG TPA: NAD(P)-dependent oxidoreductase [Hyphomicrobiaceae bacterium]